MKYKGFQYCVSLSLFLFCQLTAAHRLDLVGLMMKEIQPGSYEFTLMASKTVLFSPLLHIKAPESCQQQNSTHYRCKTDDSDSLWQIKHIPQHLDILLQIEPYQQDTKTYIVNAESPHFSQNVSNKNSLGHDAYFIIGIEHILLGLDHLLFVLALFFLITGLRSLFWALTSFTVAHSLTLILSMSQWIKVNTLFVEAMIALSIVFLIFESTHKRFTITKRYPIMMTFIFGLLHGLGFAASLSSIGLPENQQWLALLWFNLGVEVGQIAFIINLLGLSKCINALSFSSYQRHLSKTFVIYAVGGMSAFWLIERTQLLW
ncbi:MAG: HupE/UreJ family protein [Pseudomonadota bacterium]